MPPLHRPLPWQQDPCVAEMVPIRTTAEPVLDVAIVPFLGAELEALATAAMIVRWSEIAHTFEGMSARVLRSALRASVSL